MAELFDLFKTFCRIGGLTFGGGYAMLPMLQKEVVEERKWATHEELLDYYAVGQATPGIIAVNTATFIGYKVKGILGGFFATLGVVFPSFIIIITIASFLQNFSKYIIVQYAFSGIRVAVAVLVLNTIIGLIKKSILDKTSIIIFILTCLFGIFLNVSPIYIVIASSILGIIISYRRDKSC
ncbi:MAG: chromate transporter [Paraclostridium sp.]